MLSEGRLVIMRPGFVTTIGIFYSQFGALQLLRESRKVDRAFGRTRRRRTAGKWLVSTHSADDCSQQDGDY
jgi:hypothetical protein